MNPHCSKCGNLLISPSDWERRRCEAGEIRDGFNPLLDTPEEFLSHLITLAGLDYDTEQEANLKAHFLLAAITPQKFETTTSTSATPTEWRTA